MKRIISARNLKVPLTLAFLVCFVIVAMTANNRAVSVPAGTEAGAGGRPVVVIDAGHGGVT
jgi:N-acetylmuramoyl-L-alanine amidase